MWLEVFRWKHVTRTLRFNPGPPIPGTDIRPKPGRPLLFLYLCCALAPAVFAVAGVLTGRTSRLRDPRRRDRGCDIDDMAELGTAAAPAWCPTGS
jgi:hypothetical protein